MLINLRNIMLELSREACFRLADIAGVGKSSKTLSDVIMAFFIVGLMGVGICAHARWNAEMTFE